MEKKDNTITIYEIESGIEFSFRFKDRIEFEKAKKYLFETKGIIKNDDLSFVLTMQQYGLFKEFIKPD
jgi:hypothetical protein